MGLVLNIVSGVSVIWLHTCLMPKTKLYNWRYRGEFVTKLLLLPEEAFKHQVKCNVLFLFCTDCLKRLYFIFYMLSHGNFCIPKIPSCHMAQIWLASSHHLLFVDHFFTLSRIFMKVPHIKLATGSFLKKTKTLIFYFLKIIAINHLLLVIFYMFLTIILLYRCTVLDSDKKIKPDVLNYLLPLLMKELQFPAKSLLLLPFTATFGQFDQLLHSTPTTLGWKFLTWSPRIYSQIYNYPN